MKLQHLTRRSLWAICLASVLSTGTAQGADEDLGGLQDCSVCLNADCQDECTDLNSCLLADDVSSCVPERTAFEDCCSRPPPPIVLPGGRIYYPPRPRCQEGHAHNGLCHADHVCDDNQIGGGSEDCRTCPEGQEPNQNKTACRLDGTYKEARCTRRLDFRGGLALPRHPNVVVQTGDTAVQRGFFPQDEDAASENAKRFLFELASQGHSPIPPSPPEPVYVPSVVQEDSIQGNCSYVNVSKERYETVKDRMLHSVNTRPPWDEYHGIVQNSIHWAHEVLK